MSYNNYLLRETDNRQATRTFTKQNHDHLPSKLVHALEDLVAGSEAQPREKAQILAHGASRCRLLEDNLVYYAERAAHRMIPSRDENQKMKQEYLYYNTRVT